MPTFIESQKKYTDAKRSVDAARKEIYLLRQHILMLEKKIALALQNELITDLPANHTLNLERTAFLKKLSASEAALNTAQTSLTATREEFKAQGFANITLTNLNDSIPILLLPLRIQTRFLTIKYIARDIPEDLLVDVNLVNPVLKQQIKAVFPNLQPPFNPSAPLNTQATMLSNYPNPEVKRIIGELNQAGVGQPSKRRWAKVEDAKELWVRIFPDDIFMISHETALTENEISAGRIFWQQLWAAERELRLNQAVPGAEKTKNEKQVIAWKALRFECLPHRASWIARVMRPADFPDNFSTELEIIPADKFPAPEIKAESWSVPPATDQLPEQFLVKAFFNNAELAPREVIGANIPDYIQLGFDPDEKNDNAFAESGNVMELPKAIRWLTDLSEAERCGMAVKISLSLAELQSGISRLVVLGVKTAADAAEGGRLITGLFENHRFKSDGMAFLPQGSPTNNIPGKPSGFSNDGLSDEASFSLEFPVNNSTDPHSDGQRFTTALGLDPKTFINIFNHNNNEGEQALLLNRALWPGTLGYYLDNLMRPAVTDEDLAFVQIFFEENVTGRGIIPSFRVGKQPYGIVPATAWSLWKPVAAATKEEIRLVRFLKKMDDQWGRLVAKVKTMKKVFSNTDGNILEQEFRELLAFQASSTRYFRRLVAGEFLLWNVNERALPLATEKSGIKTTPPEFKAILEGVNGWNETITARPRILGKFFDDENYKLTDITHSDSSITTPQMGKGRNYLSILLELTLDQMKTGAFGEDYNKFVNQRSSRLMFYLSRFALLQGWVEAATSLLKKERPNISPLARLDFEMEYIIGGNLPSTEHNALLKALNITGTFETRKNKWAFFEEKLADGMRIDAKIAGKINNPVATDEIAQRLIKSRDAFKSLSGLPVEQLERLFSEHIDLCSFRLDAWLQGLSLSRLFANRRKAGTEKGIYLGSFGYLENLIPNREVWLQVKEIATPSVLDPASQANDNTVMPVYDFTGLSIPEKINVRKAVFVYLGSDPVTNLALDPVTKQIVQTSTLGRFRSDGFLLAPSIEHATTAAILRAGYDHHSGSMGSGSKTLAVNIDSVRTGLAMDMLKAVHAGHSLNEQLGYFIERRMYDTLAVAQYVPKLRLVFPLHTERNEWDGDQQIIESQKVTNLALLTDGLAVLNKFQAPLAVPTLDTKLTEIFQADEVAKKEFIKIITQANDQFDAVSDLALAESVFQTVKGSPERAAAALRIAGDGADITLPEIVQVPTESQVLTHRLGFVLNVPGIAEKAWPAEIGPVSILARLSPELNQWLANQLPLPGKIFAKVMLENNTSVKVGLAMLNLQAIDFFYLVQKSGGQLEESLLTWFFIDAARKMPGVIAKVMPVVSYARDESFAAGEFSVREMIALVRSIGALLEKSRPLRPADWLAMSNGAPEPGAIDYDTTLLKAACTVFAGIQNIGPIQIYLDTLTSARNALEQNLPKGFGSPASDAAFGTLMQIIPQAYFLGAWDAAPRCPDECTLSTAKILIDQANDLANSLQKRISQATLYSAEIELSSPGKRGDEVFDMLLKLARLLAGEDLLVLPRFRLINPGEISATCNDVSLAASVEEAGLDEWLQGLAMVRENVRNYQVVRNLRAVFNAPDRGQKLKILQLPFIAGVASAWIGGKFPRGFVPPSTVTSMAFEMPPNFVADQFFTGILVDDWREKVPLTELTAGVAINYNQSNGEAPQCLLLVVAPEQKGAWDWDALLNAVLETMMLAKKRAVDNEILQATWLNQFLPALVTPLDARNNTPNLDFRFAGPPIKPLTNSPDIGNGGGIFTRL